MRKLRLDLDDLTVEAFETVKAAAARGTVVGHAPTITGCGAGTCWLSCNGTCPLPCTTPDVCTTPVCP